MIQSILTALENMMFLPLPKVFLYLPMMEDRMSSWFRNISVAVARAGVFQWIIIVVLVDGNVDLLDSDVSQSPLPSEMKEHLTTVLSDSLSRTLVDRAQRLFLRGRLPVVLGPVLPFLLPTERQTVTHLSNLIHQHHRRFAMNLHVDRYWEIFQETCKQGLQHTIYTIHLDNEQTKWPTSGQNDPCQSWQDYTNAEKIYVDMNALMLLWNSNRMYYQHFISLFLHKGVQHVYLLYRTINDSLDERQWQTHAGCLRNILDNINTDSIRTLKLPFVRQNDGLPQDVMQSFITLLQKVAERKRVLDEVCVPMFQLHTRRQLPPSLPDLLISGAKTIALGVVYIQYDVPWQESLGSLLVEVLKSNVDTVSFVAPPTISTSEEEQRRRRQMVVLQASTWDEYKAIMEKNCQRTFHIFGRGFPAVFPLLDHIVRFELPISHVTEWRPAHLPMGGIHIHCNWGFWGHKKEHRKQLFASNYPCV